MYRHALPLLALPLLAHAQTPAVRSEVLNNSLHHPWALAFIDQGRMLVSERRGQLWLLDASGRSVARVAGVPAVDAGGQGGLLDVVADRRFADNRQLYFCYSEAGDGGNRTALARARLSPDGQQLQDVAVIFRQQPAVASRLHFGCRIVQQTDSTLWLTLGERFSRMQDAQRLDNTLGKVVRLRPDGSIPPDNPYVGRSDALPAIWSLGHRNPQGATLGPDGQLWLVEHGPQGGDELNRPAASSNQGWPVISYGQQYGGGPIGAGLARQDGMAQPLHYWVPSIAPSGLAWLTSARYGKTWQGSLFTGSLKFGYLARLTLQEQRVVAEEKLAVSDGQRVRDVRQGPDGLLYLLTDAPQGRLLRLLPR